MNMKKTRITGIILAGGKSRRMTMEKGLVSFNGKLLIQWSIDVFQDICTEILISSNSNCYDNLGFKVIADLVYDSGPMGGIYSCLVESKNQLNLVLSCDMPFVTVDIFNLLAEKTGDARISVPWHEDDHYEPLCGIYKKDSLQEMETFMKSKNFKLPDLFRQTTFKALRISEIHPPLPDHYFMNINNLKDLDKAKTLVGG
jgi:molybdopterin-guanine dinucleotide biosynthesis protein A